MALLQVNLISASLMRTVPLQVILPVDRIPLPGEKRAKPKPFRTLYLLHGIFGNYVDWVSGTNIQRWAEDRNLAVVMPSGDNSFYVDQPGGYDAYGRFVGEELVRLTREMFRLSDRREDTFIGGLSMGGYGALRNGLAYPETFGRIVAFSAALSFWHLVERAPDDRFILTSRTFAESRFGDLGNVDGTDRDPYALVANLRQAGAEIPPIYLTCGQADSLLRANRDFADYLRAQGAEVTFTTGEGGHDWDFWHRALRLALDWLPLEPSRSSLHSGHVSR